MALAKPKKVREWNCTVPFCDFRASAGFVYLPTKDLAQRQEWFEKLSLDPKIKCHRICPKHFEKSSFGNRKKLRLFKTKKHVPSKNLPVRQFLRFLLLTILKRNVQYSKLLDR